MKNMKKEIMVIGVVVVLWVFTIAMVFGTNRRLENAITEMNIEMIQLQGELEILSSDSFVDEDGIEFRLHRLENDIKMLYGGDSYDVMKDIERYNIEDNTIFGLRVEPGFDNYTYELYGQYADSSIEALMLSTIYFDTGKEITTMVVPGYLRNGSVSFNFSAPIEWTIIQESSEVLFVR